MRPSSHRPPVAPLQSLLVALALAVTTTSGVAAELIAGTVRGAAEASHAFSITGKSREDIVGGEIVLGEARYTIQRVSRRGLIGANLIHDAGDDSYGEFVIFSSSFSEQTASGQPWLAANTYHHCEEPYNSFLAVYRVNGKADVVALGPMPYPSLSEDLKLSDNSEVYCFISRPRAE